MSKLDGKRVLVTGAVSDGIGRAIALACAREGADVAVHYFDEQGAPALVAELAAFGVRAEAFQADFSDPAAARACVDAACGFLGGLDVLFANAARPSQRAFLDLDDSEFASTIAVNLGGSFACLQQSARAMLGHGGSIVIVSSINEDRVTLGQAAYIATKGGLRQLGRAMAAELGPSAIRVNMLCPGAIVTGFNRAALGEPGRRRHVESRIPLGRWGEPSDLTAAALFLASDDSAYMTGASLLIDGGLAIYPTQAPPIDAGP